MTRSSHNIHKNFFGLLYRVLRSKSSLHRPGGSHFTKPTHIIRSRLFDAIVTQLSLTPLKAKINSLCWHRKCSSWDANLLFSVISIYVYMLPCANSTFCHCSTVDHIYLLWGFPSFCSFQIE